MSNDTTLKSVFDYAKQGPLSGGEFPTLPAVYATWVEHFPNNHPTDAKDSADLVTYANGKMSLSQDKKKLSGEFKFWRNVTKHPPAVPTTDVFADSAAKGTIAISVSDSGQVSYQKKVNGQPIGGFAPVPLNAIYEQAMFLEKNFGSKGLSFTLGTTF